MVFDAFMCTCICLAEIVACPVIIAGQSLSLCLSLNEVLEFAEDIAIDIPKIWDYLGEILSPVVSQSALPLSILASIYPSLVRSTIEISCTHTIMPAFVCPSNQKFVNVTEIGFE